MAPGKMHLKKHPRGSDRSLGGEASEAQERERDVSGFRLPAWLRWGPLRVGEEPRVESTLSGAGGPPRRGGNVCQAQTDAPDSIMVTQTPGTWLPEV